MTFFRGGSSDAAAKHLSERVAAMVAANPWLAAVLECDPETGEMAAHYSDSTEGIKRAGAGAGLFRVAEDISVSRGSAREEEEEEEEEHTSAYDAMVHKLAPVLCKSSDDAVGTGSPLFAVTLVPDAASPKTRFAVVVSANHSLIDGHGFYRLYNMLSADAPVEALRPERKQDSPAKIVEAMGGEASTLAECPPGLLARFVFGQLRAALFPQTKAIGFRLSAEWVSAQKKKAKEENVVPFVSQRLPGFHLLQAAEARHVHDGGQLQGQGRRLRRPTRR